MSTGGGELDIESKVELAVVNLLKQKTEYNNIRAWDGSAPTEGILVTASVETQLFSEEGLPGMVTEGDNNNFRGIGWEIVVEVAGYHTKNTPLSAWRAVEDTLTFPEGRRTNWQKDILADQLSDDELYVHETRFNQPWRREVIEPFMVRVLPFTLHAGHP